MPRSLNNLLLRYQAAFLLLVLASALLGGAGIYSWSQIYRESLRINSIMQEAQEMRGHLYRQMKEVFDATFLGDAAAKAQYRHYAEALESNLEALQTHASSKTETDLVENLRAAYGQVKAQADRIMDGLPVENMEERRRIFDTDLELNAFNRYEAAFDAIDRLLASNRAELAARLSRLDQLAPLLLMVPLVLAVGLLFLSRNFLQGSVIRPLNQLLHATKAIARGDLTQPVPQTGAAELAALSQAFNQMASDLATSRDMLVQAEKNATLSALVPVVAHNIRNPLSSIRATAQVLDDPELSGEVREGLRGIINTADRLEEWTRSLLSYLHPLEPQLTRCTLTQIADSALKLLQTKLDAKDITVVREHWEHAPEQALDVDLFEQALFGLIGNAIDASPRGGKLKLGLATGAEHAKLTLGDQGSGIPFLPEQGSLTPGPTTKPFGTGLGIPFAMKVCEVHGGAIAFERNQGTEVTITLPISVQL